MCSSNSSHVVNICVLYEDVLAEGEGRRRRQRCEQDEQCICTCIRACMYVYMRVCMYVRACRSRAPCTLLYVNNINPHDCARDQIQLLFII